MFHEFYIRIDSIHNATQENESVFVESINDHLKISMMTKEEAEDDDFKECADIFQTAEYLRDRFGMLYECIIIAIWILYQFPFFEFKRFDITRNTESNNTSCKFPSPIK